MRSFMLAAMLSAGLLFCASAWALNFNVEMDQATLQQELSRAFPVQRDEAFVSVQLSQPQVILKEGSDRIGVKAMATVILPGDNKISGNTYVDGKLRYEEKTNALYLDQAMVRELNIDGLPDMARQEVLRMANLLVRSFLDKQPVYVFRDDKSSASLIKKRISKVEVKNGRLIVEVSAF